MADITIWEINKHKFTLDINDADTAEKYEMAMDKLAEDTPADDATTSARIRAYCKAFRALYDTLLGDGSAAIIFDGVPDNLRKYMDVYGDFLSFIAKQSAQAQADMAGFSKKYLPRGAKK